MTSETASSGRALGLAILALSMVAGVLAVVALFLADSGGEIVLALVAGLLAGLGPAAVVRGWSWAGLALTLGGCMLALAVLLRVL